ncbi:CsbD family protein [Sphingomonas sp.]|uniref:CsbD family protein n=1 Tax=Sphingomonas sp. TaxID=28214 RepID=UPI0028A6F45B|nr:CsbD family protein [Sphingomonas sp.]
MNEHRIQGEAHALKGSIKEAIGKITGDRRIEAEGAAEKLAGKAQAGAGEIAGTVKNKVAGK